MAATGSDPARSGATAVGRSAAGPSISPERLPAGRPAAERLPAGRPAAGRPAADAPPPGEDWASQTADAVERVVAAVRAKTAAPLEVVARALVYGLVAAIVGLAAAVLGAVALVRILDLALPGAVWAAHALTGGIFTLGGLLLWRKRTVKTVKV